MCQALRGMLLGLAVLSLSSCAKPPQEKLLPVRGTIRVQSKALPHGTVVFIPDSEKGNSSKLEPRGTIDGKDGIYVLACGERDGAPPGWYQVTVFALKPTTQETGMRPPEWLANQKYSDVKTSGLAVEVVADPKPNAYDFDLMP